MERRKFIELIHDMPREALILAVLMACEAVQNNDEPMNLDYFTQIFLDCFEEPKEGGEK